MRERFLPSRPPMALRLLAAAAAAVVALLPASALAEQPDAFTRALALGPVLGPIVASGVAFVFGVLTCATPCVFPMIIVTVSIFGAREAASRREAVLLSTSYVLGIVALFTPLFVGAALSGSLFGAALANKYVILGIAAIFVALAASMFGAFELTLPEALVQRLSGVGGRGYGGAFLLGMVMSLVAAPCVGPIATAILLTIAKSRDVGLGALFGASYALGIGLPFFLVGAFAVALPKSGKWMLWVKSFFGIAMLVAALYFLKNAFPSIASLARPGTGFVLAMAGLVALGLALGAVHLAWDDGGVFVKARKGAGIALTVTAAFLAWASSEMPAGAALSPTGPAGGGAAALLAWEHSEPVAVARARAEKRPLLVDFTAEWCTACKKLSKETLSDPRVMQKAAHFVAVKVDATDDEDPQVDAVKGKYNVVGLPTLVVYDSAGVERKRFNDFIPPETLLAAIEGVN